MRLTSSEMELYERIDGDYFTNEILKIVDISNVNLDWLED